MRAVFVGDLHYPEPKFSARIPFELERLQPDLIVLAGDFIMASDPGYAYRLLRILERRAPARLVAALGNHEYYLTRNARRRGLDSLSAARRIASILGEMGVPVLDFRGEAVGLGGLYLVGGAGWYDYSFAPEWATRKMLENCNPRGVPVEVLEDCMRDPSAGECPEWWRMDCLWVRLPTSHGDLARLYAENIERQVRSARGRPVLLVLHHVPRQELIRRCGCTWDLNLAYAGSLRLGRPVRRWGLRLVFYGHVHEYSLRRAMVLDGTVYVNTYPWDAWSGEEPPRPSLVLLEVSRGFWSLQTSEGREVASGDLGDLVVGGALEGSRGRF